MKVKIYLYCVAVAAATFISGVGFFAIGHYFQSVVSSGWQKTEVAASAPIVTEQAETLLTEQDNAAKDSENKTADEFDAEGFYGVIGKLPKNFEDFGEIGITTKNYESASEENNYEGTPISPEGYVWTDKEYKFTKISISSQTMAFETETIKGVSYKFSGKFVEKVPFWNFNEQKTVLEGHLIKLKKEKKIAETNINFFWYEGGC